MARLEALQTLVARDENDSFSRYGLAMELVSAGRLDEAVVQFLEVRRRDPSYVALYYQLAKAYETMNRVEKATEAYREGIRVARAKGDLHAVSELQSALEELEDQKA